MSNSIRFEFYNNFDIWCDLYQENDGDPNYIINVMIYVNKNIFRYGNGCGHGNKNGNGHEYGYGYGYGDGYRNGNGYEHEYGYGTFYENGNGTL